MDRQRLYGICLVKDEDDVIGQTLDFAARHCDRIFVIDNGSTDRTWEIVQERAAACPRVVPYVRTLEPYHDGLRALAYNAYRGDLGDDDWWLILDGDEFLAEDPRPVMQRASGERAEIINAWQIQFYYTDRDYEAYAAGADRRDRPIFARRRYYLINWQEPRLFRNRPARAWNSARSAKVPDGHTRIGRRRILNRHYQFRDPEQIQKRLAIRYGHASFRHHVPSPEWRDYIRPAGDLNYYRDGENWRFTAGGLFQFYQKQITRTARWKAGSLMRILRVSASRRRA